MIKWLTGYARPAAVWDILYAVDASTSMGEASRLRGAEGQSKVSAVKEGIIHVVNGSSLPFGSRVGVIGFRAPTKAMGMMVDSKQEMVQKVLALKPVAELTGPEGVLRGYLDGLAIGGATPTGEALRTAVEMVHEGSDGQKRIKKVILVTDEKSNVGPKPEKIIDPKLTRRAIIDVVALGTAADRKAFEAIASRSGGKFMVAEDTSTLNRALDPRIPYMDAGAPDPVLAEAERIRSILKATDKGAASYRGLASAAEAVRLRLAQRLQDVISLEGQTRADVDVVVSAAVNDPKFATMSMREFADRVWSRAAELAKLQTTEAAYRKVLGSLQG